MHKNGFLTFVLAMIPGAGQMYYGYMRRGLSLMLAFFAGVAATSIFGLLGFLLPVIWAYCFFDTFRLRTALENGTAEPDDYLFGLDPSSRSVFSNLLCRRHLLLGWGLVALGAYLLLENFVIDPLLSLGYQLELYWLTDLLTSLPSLVVAALLILLGIRLVRGRTPKEPDSAPFLPEGPGGEEDAHHE